MRRSRPKTTNALGKIIIGVLVFGCFFLIEYTMFASFVQPTAEINLVNDRRGKNKQPRISYVDTDTAGDLFQDLCLQISERRSTRASVGTNVELPSVQFTAAPFKSKMEYPSLCLNPKDPLRVVILATESSCNESVMLQEQLKLWQDKSFQHSLKHLIVTLILHIRPLEGDNRFEFATAVYKGSSGSASITLGSLSSVNRWSQISNEILQDRVKPHFVFELPPGVLLSKDNLRGLCYLDTVANDESEATSTYPFATPFLSPNRRGRTSVGFLAEVYDAGDPHSSQLALISTCKKTVMLPNRNIDGRHYSKGGDMAVIGGLWWLDVGNVLSERHAVSAAKRTLLVPYFLNGVHPDVMLRTTTDTLLPATNVKRSNVLTPIRKLVDTHCSSDPSDPARVSSHMALFVNLENLAKPRNAFGIFTRSINATALMTRYSDLTITTNVPASALMNIIRAEVRNLPADTFFSNNGPLLNGSASEGFMFDDTYHNPLGEFVITTFKRPTSNSWHYLPGYAHVLLISQMGFYDFTRYTEDDLFLTRDQFETFCATLPVLEAKDMFLNFLRFEAKWEDLDIRNAISSSTPSPTAATVAKSLNKKSPSPIYNRSNLGYIYKKVEMDVLQARIPRLVNCPDYFKDFKSWKWRRPFAVQLSTTNQSTDRRYTDSTLPNSQLFYNYTEISIQQCSFIGVSNTHFLSQKASVEGCYIFAPALDDSWKLNMLYSGFFMLPSHRIVRYFLNGKPGDEGAKNGFASCENKRLPWTQSMSRLYREDAVFYKSPLTTYSQGGAVLLYREAEDWLKSTLDPNNGYFGWHRLGAVNHGRNQFANSEYHKSKSRWALRLPTFVVKDFNVTNETTTFHHGD